jgi:hypothetical protein
MCLVWESRELMAVRTAFARLLARSASIQTVQLALYATVSGALTMLLHDCMSIRFTLKLTLSVNQAVNLASMHVSKNSKLKLKSS